MKCVMHQNLFINDASKDVLWPSMDLDYVDFMTPSLNFNVVSLDYCFGKRFWKNMGHSVIEYGDFDELKVFNKNNANSNDAKTGKPALESIGFYEQKVLSFIVNNISKKTNLVSIGFYLLYTPSPMDILISFKKIFYPGTFIGCILPSHYYTKLKHELYSSKNQLKNFNKDYFLNVDFSFGRGLFNEKSISELFSMSGFRGIRTTESADGMFFMVRAFC